MAYSKFAVDARKCDPQNECQVNNGGCSQVCVDTYDSYYCTCREGYELAPNTYTCPSELSHDLLYHHVCRHNVKIVITAHNFTPKRGD